VAKALTSLLTKSDSPLVKAKLETLAASFRQTPNQSDATESGTPDLNGLIKRLLWRTMHRGICHSQKPCKLSPLGSLATENQWNDSLLDNAGAHEDGYKDISFLGEELHSVDGDYDEDMLSDEPNLGIFVPSGLDLLLSDDELEDDFYFSETEHIPFAADFDLPLPEHVSVSSPTLLSMQPSLATSPLLDACDVMDGDLPRVAPSDKLGGVTDMVMLDCSSPVMRPEIGLANLDGIGDADMLL
jgi:hypothetical protein